MSYQSGCIYSRLRKQDKRQHRVKCVQAQLQPLLHKDTWVPFWKWNGDMLPSLLLHL